MLLVFRRTPHNRYTLATLAGAIQQEVLSGRLSLVVVDNAFDIPQAPRDQRMVVAYSFMTPKLDEVVREVELLSERKDRNRFVLVAGGAHPTADPRGTLRLGFDTVVRGEGELVLQHLLDSAALAAGNVLDGPPVGELDRFLSVAQQLGLRAPIEITRGCRWGCAYCQTPGLFGKQLRHRSMASIVESLRFQPYRWTHFRSPDAFSYMAESPSKPNTAAIEQLLVRLRHSGMQQIHMGCYPSEVRPERIRSDVLEVIRQHCTNRTVVIGAQSGSDRILRQIKRGHDVGTVIRACELIHKADLRPHVDFVFGFPGEEPEDQGQTVSLIHRLVGDYGARIHAHCYLPLPGTPLWPRPTAPLTLHARQALQSLSRGGLADGYWLQQEQLSQSILRWRDQGKILV